tara:strand:+ start:1932 stop:2438 length:507 start_codon:yes stop_codon:yes gene_type:complete
MNINNLNHFNCSTLSLSYYRKSYRDEVSMLKVLFLLFVGINSAMDFFGGFEGIQEAQSSLESRVNDRIQFAVMENDRQAYFSALASLRAAVNETNFKSAKARYFLARQYQMMNSNGLKSDSKQSFYSSMRTHFQQAAKLGDTNLHDLPSNKVYAQKSKLIIDRLNATR